MKHSSDSSNNSRSLHQSSGVVLIWTMFIILPIFFIGFIFLSYAELSVYKLLLQLRSNNAVIFGTRSAEFDTDDALYAMAADIYAGTTSSRPKPDETWQQVDDFQIGLEHNVREGGGNTVTAFVWKEVGPFDSFIAQVGNIDVSTVSQGKPEPIFISNVIDLSISLIMDRDTSDILEAFGVVDSDGNPGPNGKLVNGQVFPKEAAQLALPGGMTGRMRVDWRELSSAWAPLQTSKTGCVPSGENWCGGMPIPQEGNLRNKYTNLFMAYKKAALILLGVIGQITPYLDIELLGGPIPGWVETFINDTIIGTSPPDPSYTNYYTPFVSDGVHPLWHWDEISVASYGYSISDNPPLRPVIDQIHDYENPKSIWEDDILMDPSRPMLIQMNGTRARKALLYNTFGSQTDGLTISPSSAIGKQVINYLSPPLPVLTNPAWNPAPIDSLPHNTGDMLPNGQMPNELFYYYGLPAHPVPILTLPFEAYTINSYTPKAYKDGYVYTCSTSGVPRYYNHALQQGKKDQAYLPGFPPCLLADFCDDGMLNDSPGCDPDKGSLDPDYEDVYHDTGVPDSPRCANGTESPRCILPTGKLDLNGAPVCAAEDKAGNPIGRCWPNAYASEPRCVPTAGANDPDTIYAREALPGIICSTDMNGHHTCSKTEINNGTCAPPAGGIVPKKLGTITVPDGPAPLVGANVFFALNDMGIMNTGTYTHNAIPTARCNSFRNAAQDSDKPCSLVLVTDGRPLVTDPNGNFIISDDDLKADIQAKVDDFVNNYGGTIFTWYLKHFSRFESIRNEVESMSGTLTPEQLDVFNNHFKSDPPTIIPEGTQACADWSSIVGVMNCPDINHYIENHIRDEDMIDWFSNYMDDPPNKVWIDTDIANAPTGPDISGSLATFLTGIRQVVAAMKQEAKLHR